MIYDCVIIGGGAAGLFCAIHAAQRGRTVAIVDHANKVGKKILMSGGGRCNFTNYFVEPENFISKNPHFCISALKRFTQYDFISFVEKHQLSYHEKHKGQLFCSNKAKDLLNILLSECEQVGVDIFTNCVIQQVQRAQAFELNTSLGDFYSESLVIATGGLSIPTMGATGLGYDIAKQFGLKLVPRLASLVPFTLKGERLSLCQSLAGTALPVKIHSERQSFLEDLLFTHKGLSGPAVLQISNYWRAGEPVTIDFLPNQSIAELVNAWRQDKEKASLQNLLSRHLPKRFVQAWLSLIVVNDSIANLSYTDVEALEALFHRWQLVPAGTEGYRTAEVTLGGVDTDGISSKTFEAKTVPGLFFIGEVLDVTGWLGGFNFQWAWASAYCAAQYV